MRIIGDYNEEDIINFLKEEFERIIVQYPHQKSGTLLSDAQALGIWFLHQEVGIDYSEANEHILDDKNDCGVDLIWIDEDNDQILVGQVEYESRNWSRNPANQNKAIETFNEFRDYLASSSLPEKLHEAAQGLWRKALKFNMQHGFSVRYLYITPKYFSNSQEEQIKEKSGIFDYEFFTHTALLERGKEFLDGHTGMCSFKIPFEKQPLHIRYDFGSIYVLNVKLKEIHKIVELHEKKKRLRALFASNVRSYLNTKKRSKQIADAMRETIKNEPNHFLICNNGVTIQCNKVEPKKDCLFLKRASISNGCQTVMNIDRFFKEHEGADPDAEVLVNVIELLKNAPLIAGEIARSRNFQNPVDNRDLMSNHPLLVTLHHRFFANKLHGSEKRYYLLRKQGEKQTILKEEPGAKGKFMWIDADSLARCIASVIRQNPSLSKLGTNDIFGKYFETIFPGVLDPTHNRCKYANWFVQMVRESYANTSKWRGVKDKLIYLEKDFKSPAVYVVSALIARQLKEHFSFNENLEKRFVEKCEKWWYNKKFREKDEFDELLFEMIDDYYRLLHAISKTLLGKKLPKARKVYTDYEDLFKGPNYDDILLSIHKGNMRTYQNKSWNSMGKFVEYLKSN